MRAKVVVDQDVAISWAGKSIPVGNEAVRQVIKAADQFSAQIQSTTSHEDKVKFFNFNTIITLVSTAVILKSFCFFDIN